MRSSEKMLKNSKEEIKIMLTGGHAATPGLAVIQKLKSTFKNNNLSIYWIGSKKAIEGSHTSTLEYKIFPNLGVNFIGLTTGKIQTKLTKHTIPSLLKIPIGFVQSFFTIIKINPKVIISFGGYASFPVVFWGWFFRIPVILHEQTTVVGRASYASSFFSTKIALSRKESISFFPKSKVVMTGNPVRNEIFEVKPKIKPGMPATILIMGGSRGSEFINEEILKVMPKLVNKYSLIHVTGESHYNKIKSFARKNYQVMSSVDPLQMPNFYQQADLIVSRSGANTVSEIIVTKRPSILIPLPRTFMDEQVKNAKYAENFGIAKVLMESEVTPDRLTLEIENIFNNWSNIQKGVSGKLSPDVNATKKLVDLATDYILE